MPLDDQELENLELARDTYDAFKRGDIQSVLDGLDVEVEWRAPGPTVIPICGSWHGRDGAAQFFATLAEHVEIMSFEDREYICQGERVVVLAYVRGLVTATGRQYGSEVVHVLTVRGGKVTHWVGYSDTAEVLAAFRPPA